MKKYLCHLTLTLALTVGCSSTQKQPTPIEKPNEPVVEVPVETPVVNPVESAPTVIVDADCKPNTWSSEYDSIIKNAIKDKENLKKLNKTEAYWVGFFKALAKAESCLKLTTRYVEPPSLGKDLVTGMQNTSEGLLQLSYQDSKLHGCKFDWNADKGLNATNPAKTIFNAKNNLECGVIILDKQIKARGVLVSPKNYYWAVLNTNNKRYKVFTSYLNKEGFSI